MPSSERLRPGTALTAADRAVGGEVGCVCSSLTKGSSCGAERSRTGPDPGA